jgi:hypothetical protein
LRLTTRSSLRGFRQRNPLREVVLGPFLVADQRGGIGVGNHQTDRCPLLWLDERFNELDKCSHAAVSFESV